ncbi:protein kinase domain-containing protein [Bacillus dakarensis]|uniref:protein kinase domain-containing protein n=1 Tax=Robertmurraya dakarensis TaxID=1926278 RepID=UPI000981D839|nr:protein kinase [Bacillus dakarensis]
MEKYDHLCLGCMEDKGAESVCPHCGWVTGTGPAAPQHLPPGTILQEKYLLGRVLGHGGFGITYLAWDLNLDTKLAIKEYMPRDFATRSPDQTMVSVFTGDLESHFEYGLKNFLDEAKTLAQFNNHPGIVGVRDFFKENRTAYLVMYYLEGIDFKQYLESQGGKIPFQTALRIMLPVMDALREVHSTGTLHRDISPDNIYITAEGQVKVLDFGAARHAISEFSKSISVVLKPGYAPEEQYRSKGKQGPWTDVYAAAATLYRAIVGHTPPESLDRLEEDSLVPPSSAGVDIPEKAEAALLKALSVRAADRYQTMEEFQQDFLTNINVNDDPVADGSANEGDSSTSEKIPSKMPQKKSVSKWLWIGGGAAAILFLAASIVGAFFLFDSFAGGKDPIKPVETKTTIPEDKDVPDDVIKELSVPNLINITEEDAKVLLQEEGLKLGEITYVENLYVKKGIVTKQSVNPEETATENDVINLEVSKGIALPLDEQSIKSQHLQVVYDYWDKGYELNQQKNYNEALKLYTQARDMAVIIYDSDGNFDAQYSMGVLNRNISLMKRVLGYYEYALIDIQSSVDILEDLLTKDPLFQQNHAELANSYGEMSYIQFLNKAPKDAVVSAEKAIELDPTPLLFKVNLAHAYLFSDQYDKAASLYTNHKDEKVNEGQTFKDFVLQDFTHFKQMKLTHPDMEKIEEIYSNPDADVYSDEEEIEITIYANGLAYEAEDIAGYMSTIDPNSPIYASTEDGIKDFFEYSNNIQLDFESIEILEINGNNASAKVVQTLSYSDGKQNYKGTSTLIHHMVRSDGIYKWLITTTEIAGG